MKASLTVAAVLLGAACVQPGHVEPAPRLGLIEGVGVYQSWHDWKMTPWVRIAEDMTRAFPVMVIRSTGNRVCLVDGPTWALAKAGERHDCASGWRQPRGPGRLLPVLP